MIAWLNSKALNHIVAETVEKLPQETGGVLMGYFTGDGGVVIEEIIGPGPKAIHSKSSFHPDHEWQEKEVARIYLNSSRTITYLGDWHSHPKGTTCLSNKDGATLLKIAMSPTARVPAPLMLIISTSWKGCPQKLSIWQYVSHGDDSILVDEISKIVRYDTVCGIRIKFGGHNT